MNMQVRGFGGELHYGKIDRRHEFDVPGIVAVGASDDGVFTLVIGEMILVAQGATHIAGISTSLDVGNAEFFEEASICTSDLIIGNMGLLGRSVESVEIFHDKLFGTQKTSSGPLFIAVLAANLIETEGASQN